MPMAVMRENDIVIFSGKPDAGATAYDPGKKEFVAGTNLHILTKLANVGLVSGITGADYVGDFLQKTKGGIPDLLNGLQESGTVEW